MFFAIFKLTYRNTVVHEGSGAFLKKSEDLAQFGHKRKISNCST